MDGASTVTAPESVVRPAAHAGRVYSDDRATLESQLCDLFLGEGGPGMLPWEGERETLECSGIASSSGGQLRGIMSPHIDFRRGGSAYGWAYDRVLSETDADVFVIFGTAHLPLPEAFSISKRDFDTPLGLVRNDRNFSDSLQQRYTQLVGDQASAMFGEEQSHDREHAIELQTVLLQYALGGRRDFTVLPILVNSFHRFVDQGRQPDEAPEIRDFVFALQETIRNCGQKVCLISGVDLAHVGPEFGDDLALEETRLRQLWSEDQQLMAKVCSGDACGWFDEVASTGDKNRICGLAPMYLMLQTLEPARGELMKYEQAVSEDQSSCVSFASAVLY